ncbi:4605_t:CDS:2 [Funneliformis geosporum]|uniref:5043_t:CDS:1 n=1 Tax=Funneliformis geosporum TaxID=1117311 RepID=A0A9W4T1J6_9GLOM|nr:5043_t:CDS:2 [Funneliformis geosporum]CAI2187240.1 4605_t:CDS:2 [Funneliformis geosporum]
MTLVKFPTKTYKRNRTFLQSHPKTKSSHDQEIKDNFNVPDIIDYNLNGLFSGKKSIKEKHHYSSSNNYFYYALYESGITNGDKLTYQDDRRLARDYKIGIVTLVSRPENRSKTKLSVEEIKQGFPSLLEKVEKYRPKVLCFNGKAIFQAFTTFQTARIHSFPLKKKLITEGWGEQPNHFIRWEDHTGHTKVFYVMSTSGRVAQYSVQDRVKYFEKLKELIDNDSSVIKAIEDSNVTYIGSEELDFRIKEKSISLANAHVKKALNEHKCYEFNDMDNTSTSDNKRKNKQEKNQDYSPPKFFMAKRW